LGHLNIDIHAHIGKGEVTLPLQARPGKKDKVKGTLTFKLLEQGIKPADLGSSLLYHFAKKLTGDDKWESRTAVEKMYRTYSTLCGSEPGLTAKQVQQFLAELSNSKGSGEAEIAAVMRIYDDDGDQHADFFELMTFFIDSVTKGQTAQGKSRFMLAGAFSAMLKDDGHMDQDTLRKLLEAMVPMHNDRDPEKMKAAVDEAVKEVMDGLDKNHDGTVSMKELRTYCLESPALQTVIRELCAIPMKPKEAPKEAAKEAPKEPAK